MEITLVQAIFGIGNENQDHVHRHNTLNISSEGIDLLKIEQMSGGVSQTSLNNVAAMSGGISARPTGEVSIEDGWNVRRGIGLLRFIVNTNALVEEELSVVGYLTGGVVGPEGISEETLFVPVRSWKSVRQNTAGLDGFPVVKNVITETNQFLMGDPNQQKSMRSLRPVDIGEETLGLLAVEEDGELMEFGGSLNSDLSNNVLSSKTNNLDPVHHSRMLLKIGLGATSANAATTIQYGVADTLLDPGLQENSVSNNEFFNVMQTTLGHFSLRGFSGWSMGEITSVFNYLPDVLNINLLNTSNFAENNNLLDSHAYGSASNFEIIASELAYLTVHLLIRAGLSHLSFSATNNPNDFGGIEGSDDGVVVMVGAAGSVLEHDEFLPNRVENFIGLLKSHFFSKYNTGYSYNQTLINVEVDCAIFGETSVTLFFNGDATDTRKFVNATYAINRTSTNIADSSSGLSESKGYLNNLKDYFVN